MRPRPHPLLHLSISPPRQLFNLAQSNQHLIGNVPLSTLGKGGMAWSHANSQSQSRRLPSRPLVRQRDHCASTNQCLRAGLSLIRLPVSSGMCPSRPSHRSRPISSIREVPPIWGSRVWVITLRKYKPMLWGRAMPNFPISSTPNAEPDGSAHLDNSSLSGLVP